MVGDMGAKGINAERSAVSVTRSPDLLSVTLTGYREKEIMKSVRGARYHRGQLENVTEMWENIIGLRKSQKTWRVYVINMLTMILKSYKII